MDLNETKIIYIFINLLLLLTFVLGGYNIKRGGSYWKMHYRVPLYLS